MTSGSVSSLALAVASQAARRAVLSVFENIRLGHLSIHDRTTSRTLHFPSSNLKTTEGDSGQEQPYASLVVVKDVFWLRMAAMSDLGFAEAYMFGDVLCSQDDLLSLFRVSFVSLHFAAMLFTLFPPRYSF